MHCEHKFKRTVDTIYTCKICGKVVCKTKKMLVKEKDERRKDRDSR